jgi:hypothetical protein
VRQPRERRDEGRKIGKGSGEWWVPYHGQSNSFGRAHWTSAARVIVLVF